MFSDKTGTLTQNVMEFKKFSVGAYTYGSSKPNCDVAGLKKKGITNVNFEDKELNAHLANMFHENNKGIMRMLEILAVCHTVVVEEKNGMVTYNASSPDELALVNGAKYLGYSFKGRDDEDNILMEFGEGQLRKYRLLNVIEFNSTRKRMTVIVRDEVTGRVRVMCKGADSIILPRLKKDAENVPQTVAFLENYSKEGLRTLLIAEKEISDEVYEAWSMEYNQALIAPFNREEQMDTVAEKLEHEFDLVGSTAIEDKLQDEVADTIEFMKKAGIKVWVLTGDKIETAINIGISCKLLNDNMETFIIDQRSTNDIMLQITKHRRDQKLTELARDNAVIVAGDSLLKIQKNDRVRDEFLTLALAAKVVVACRVSPKQKAEIVTMVRQKKRESTTLAIGDGANDVNMISAAHVGIGISGLEGQQAARSSDYAIGQFKYLKTLLFVHGREAYRRNSFLISFMFYKNMLFAFPIFCFGFYSAFSATEMYNQLLYQCYNIFFTGTPILYFAIFDFEYTKEELSTNHRHYRVGFKSN